MPFVENRRRFERVPFFAPVTVVPQPGGRPIQVRTIDISLGGVGIVCPTTLPNGQLVSLTFHLSAGARKIDEHPVMGRVTNHRFVDDAIIIGIEFASILDRSFVPALVQSIERL